MRVAGFAVACAAVVLAFATGASAACQKTEVRDVQSVCLERGCAPGSQVLYRAKLRNLTGDVMFLMYEFDRPDGAWIKGGLEMQPFEELTKPIGFGTSDLAGNDPTKWASRFRLVECGTDEDIKFRWHR